MTSYIPSDLRRLVFERADGRCEYCRICESDTFYGCQIDHIIAEKHNGETTENNLALTCTYCNRFKGTDIGSIAATTGEYVRFYNPRTDNWNDHFRFANYRILPLTPIGETTSAILRFNDPDRVLEREAIGD
jgi:hypothetical protein